MPRRGVAAQIADELRERARAMQPGDRFPSERVLLAEHDAARNTVRDAIGRLVGEGLLRVVHGYGTFVADPEAPPPPKPTLTRASLAVLDDAALLELADIVQAEVAARLRAKSS